MIHRLDCGEHDGRDCACAMISPLAAIGEPPEHRDHRHLLGIPPEISPGVRIEAFCTVDAGTTRATRIGARTWLMKGCHVAHDCIVGEDCELSPHVALAGWVEVGDRVRIGMGATIRNRIRIGDGARIGMGAVVIRDVPPGVTVVGNPAAQMLTGKSLRQRQAETDGTSHPEMRDDAWEELLLPR